MKKLVFLLALAAMTACTKTETEYIETPYPGIDAAFESEVPFIVTPERTKVAVVLPENLAQSNFKSFEATITGGATQMKWKAEVTAPTFTNGVYDKNAAVTLTVTDGTPTETVVLNVSVTDTKGVTRSISRALQYFDDYAEQDIAGTLEEALADQTIHTLKVVGAINADDFGAIRELTDIEYLDLSEAAAESIPNSALMNLTALRYISLPRTATLGRWMFENCTALRQVVFPAEATAIPASAFYGCGIETLDIPASITSIGDWAFESCASLKRIVIPATVTSVGKSVFYMCEELESVRFDNTMTAIPENVFYLCKKLSSVNIPNGVTAIEADAFNGCKLLELSALPASVRTIGNRAFSYCKITSMTFHEGIASIGQSAFSGITLSNIDLPSTLTTLGDSAFEWSNVSGTITFRSTVPPSPATNLDPDGNPQDFVNRASMANWTVKVPSASLDAYKTSAWGAGTTVYGGTKPYFDPAKMSAL